LFLDEDIIHTITQQRQIAKKQSPVYYTDQYNNIQMNLFYPYCSSQFTQLSCTLPQKTLNLSGHLQESWC